MGVYEGVGKAVCNSRVLKVGGAGTPEVYSNHAMTGKELPRLSVTGDGRVAHVHHRVLDIGVPQPVLHEGDICAGVQQMDGNCVAARLDIILHLMDKH